MIFAEFEREMTFQRTAANAYERSKRGLANGGGYLVVEEAESKVTQEIFTTYLREQAIKLTTEAVRERHQTHVRTRITRSNVYWRKTCAPLGEMVLVGLHKLVPSMLGSGGPKLDRSKARNEIHTAILTYTRAQPQ